MADLFEDYIQEVPALMAAYAAPPRTIAQHGVDPRPWNPALVAGMRAYHEHLGLTTAFQGDEAVIITGQQPGIFTGPLYTIYKAITALRLARHLGAETGTPFAPIYWVGGDDHDFEEINHVGLLSKHHTAVNLELPPAAGQRPQSVYQLPAGAALHNLIDVAAQQAPGSEFSADIAAFLHESVDKADNLSEWHARLMARLFRDTPLLLFAPDLPEARHAAIPVFEHEIRHPLVSTRHVNEGGERLEAAGYGAQVVKGDDACNFFFDSQDMRCRVQYVDGSFMVPETGERFDQAALLALLHASPERFTANVALRCVVQQHLFPVRAYVAGPGELAYWGQLKGVFEQFGLEMPIVYPRIRSVLTTLKTNKLLKKFGLRPGDLLQATSDLEERALRATQRDPAMEVLARHQRALEGTLEALETELQALGRPGRAACDLAAAFAAHVRRDLEQMERRLLRADEQRTETIRNQMARLVTELAPDRKPQERFYTLFSWMFQHGWDLVPRLVESLDHQDFGMQEVEL